jgi:formimidoylglutamate deiminase
MKTIPAMVNAHSHAFQRALRGRGERPSPNQHDDFWSWRAEMFALAGSLDPAGMRRVALETYSEMVGAGYGVVGEFHYVHHQPDGTPYPEANEMALAVAEAAVEAGLAIVMLPAAYHRGGWSNGADLPPASGQRRFCDPDVDTFLARVDGLRSWAASVPGVSVGIAAHSVRAVPRSWLEAIASYSERHHVVRHVHASEQRRELAECQAEHGCSPIELLSRTGFLGELASVIHGIHVSDGDVALLASTGTTVVSCPTTEGNLGDGYLPAMAYAEAGVPLAIGSDSQVRIDPFEEARELETGSRRERQLRSGLLAAVGDLWDELCRNGYRSLGLEGESPTVEIDLEHPDLRGVDPSDLPLALVTCASAGVVAR